ncbi:SusC/RagA family TonB-linked outer membrane protein [Mucilaginibacter sabulilitoris]|uniref:SusC/RagA family TonB-linked outer membrane protein n=1 Tax=Mucilaginibacter sabulilitoris TaxID=1173583 RepID=A0ABZ0TV28_9SPHI|nr:SusC/RagA family TonB-linked outer membrane protein [Mucilaginibacter sabulilitoris]WPU95644.1 SusC/RagA family TonB-linked outer membrane protein [Mucilaginibacter sabulilitoris]
MYSFYKEKLVRPCRRASLVLKAFLLAAILMVILNMQVSASPMTQKVTLAEKNSALLSVMEKISTQTGFDFILPDGVIPFAKPVTITVQQEELAQVLKKIFDEQPLNYELQEKIVVISRKMPAVAQKLGTAPKASVRVSGEILDSTGKGLSSATVQIRARGTVTYSDEHGRFAINAEPGDQVSVSFVGYQTFTFTVLENMPFQSIRLKAATAAIAEVAVVSTGYQNLPKERATGSFAQLNNELINRRVGTDIVSRLEGVTPGLLFNRNTSGASRGNNDISIRGTNTLFSNSQPLIVLDGFPFDGDISNINPNDIENITILKDAAAASIWGVRSGNGVIVLNSKKGKRNEKLSVELNANLTASAKPDLFYNPSYLNSSDYIDIEQRLFKTGFFDGQIGDPLQVTSPVVNILAAQREGSLSAADADAQINALRKQDTRSQLDKYFYRRGFLQQYSTNLRGGGDKSDYYFSAGEDHNAATLTGNDNNRITLNANYNFYPLKNLQLSAAVNYIQTKANANSTAANITAGGRYVNFSFPYESFADGNANALPIVKGMNYEFAKGAQQQGYLDWLYRPLEELRNADNTSSSVENRINASAQYRLIPGLDLSLKYQFEKQITNADNYYSQATYYTRNLINEYAQPSGDATFTYPVPNTGILQQSDGVLTSHHARGQISFDREVSNGHRVTAIIGAEVSSAITESRGETVYGYDKNTRTSFAQIDYANYFNLNPESGAAQIPTNLGFEKFTDHYISYFGNAAYSYLDRYSFSVSGRIDRSNLFGVSTNQKSVPLYSTGLAWDVSKEQFYHISWLPNLKVRATYGYNANVNKSASAITTLEQQSNAYYSGVPYNIINSPGNPELRWEKVRIANFGMDYSLKNNLLSGSFEYYTKRGIDLFGTSPLAPSAGFTTFFGNTANTAGHGFDFVLNTRNIYRNDLKWVSNLLLSYVIDKVTVYDSPASALTYLASGSGNGGTITPFVGQPIYGIYSFRSGPLTHDTGDPQGYIDGQLSTDYKNIISKTGIADLYYNGPSRPTTFGSLRNTFSYKNWTLSANIIFKLNYYFRRTSTGLSYDQIAYGLVNSDYAKRWQNPGDEAHTNVPSILMPPSSADRYTFYQYSEALVDKGDHIRLQDIRLAYAFRPFGGNTPVFKRLEVFSYLNNLGILWRANKDHLDPDLYAGAYPLPRTLSIGFNARF